MPSWRQLTKKIAPIGETTYLNAPGKLCRSGASRASRPRLDFESIGAAARGQWTDILHALAPALTDALEHPGRHRPCPVHGGRDGFRYTNHKDKGGGICNTCGKFHDGFALLGWVNGWRPGEALREVGRVLGVDHSGGPPSPRSMPSSISARTISATAADPERNRARLRRAWGAALPLYHPDAGLARCYLLTRGLGELIARGDLPQDIRLHPALPYWYPDLDRKLVNLGAFPALMSIVRAPDGTAVALHRTYLDGDGTSKAHIPNPDKPGEWLPAKKLLTLHEGATRRAAIRLYEAAERLTVGEGLETCLSGRVVVPELPVWATISAGGMARLAVPDAVRELIIMADHDASGTGKRAAQALAKRMCAAGKRVRIALPKEIGQDWNDVLQEAYRHD